MNDNALQGVPEDLLAHRRQRAAGQAQRAAQPRAAGQAQTASATSLDRLTEDFNKFLNLLTTQLKNQDPLDPVDTTEFTNQLVQFASVEQLIQQNANMEKFIRNQKLDIASTAVSYIGRTVEVPSPQTTLQNGSAVWNYELRQNAASIFLHVVDPANGEIIRSISGSQNRGTHQVVWDGSDGAGGRVADGRYILAVQAIDLDGERMTADVNGYGAVTSVKLDKDEPTVVVFGREVPLSSVASVSGGFSRQPTPPDSARPPAANDGQPPEPNGGDQPAEPNDGQPPEPNGGDQPAAANGNP